MDLFRKEDKVRKDIRELNLVPLLRAGQTEL